MTTSSATEFVAPTDVRIGDTIGSGNPVPSPFVVETINGPQTHGHPGKPPTQQWTFDGHDRDGNARIATYPATEPVPRYAKGGAA